jgi:hypothetical protein
VPAKATPDLMGSASAESVLESFLDQSVGFLVHIPMLISAQKLFVQTFL